MNSGASLLLAEVTRLTGVLGRKCEPEGRVSRENFLDGRAAPGSVLAVTGSWEQLGCPACPLHLVLGHLLPATSLSPVNGLHGAIFGRILL